MSDDFFTLLEAHIDKQTLSKKRKARTGIRCQNNCTNRMLCPDSHGDELNDLEHCLCEAWWCPKSHPNRSKAFSVPMLHETTKPPKGYICKRCKSTEHYVNKCPQNVCTYCQDIGHIATSCPHNIEHWQNLKKNMKARRMYDAERE